MQQSTNQLIVAGMDIPTDNEGRVNLNALFKASGVKKQKNPSQWMRLDSSNELVAEIEQNVNMHSAPIASQNGGKTPGIFAHELLAISYAGWISPKFQLMVNQAFIDMKTGKLQPQPKLSRIEILNLALEAEQENLKLKAEVVANEPKINVYKRLVAADGSVCMRDAAKSLQLRPGKLIDWLSTNKWIYKRIGNQNWIGYQEKIQKGWLIHKVDILTRDDGTEKTVTQVRITPKGLVQLGDVFANKVA
jgi:phage antirepressor YoqD-like protein